MLVKCFIYTKVIVQQLLHNVMLDCTLNIIGNNTK